VITVIKRIFITGLAAIIPIVITIYVIIGLFVFADGILGKFINKFLKDYIGLQVPGLGIIITILIVFVVGLLIRISRMRLFKFMERVFFRIPLVNKIYPPIKRVVDFLFFPSKKAFKTAVLVEYPRQGIYSLGFITNETSSEFNKKIGKKSYNVFIPSSPSPLTGFTIIVREEDVIFLDMGVEEAIKLVVSGGLLNPYE
jgi:uncharacterized membrane protein